MENNPEENDEQNSLESPEIVPEREVSAENSAAAQVKTKQSFGKKMQSIVGRLNIYLLLFILIVIITGLIVFVGIQRNKKAEQVTTINTQELSNETLDKLKGTQAKVGDPKQILTIESNAIFTGKVLFRDSIDVAGIIKVGGPMSLPGLTVSGQSNLDQIQGNSLSISGDTTLQGQLTVKKNLSVAGGGSFGGAVSVPVLAAQSLQISGDLTFSRHIDAGGGTPGLAWGSALGAGGTASLNGTDTAGTLTINTGGGPGAGCFATISFAQRFGSTPHVNVTPIGFAAGGLNFYVNRSSTSFSVCSTNAAPGGQSFAFDYIVID